jgi:hypothetical protein
MDLPGNLEIIHGVQSLTGKILSHKDLAHAGVLSPTPLSPWQVSAIAILKTRIVITYISDFSHRRMNRETVAHVSRFFLSDAGVVLGCMGAFVGPRTPS